MDYGAPETLVRHKSWSAYKEIKHHGRLILFTTKGATPLPEFKFQPHDRLLFGRESAGVPDNVHEEANARVLIPTLTGTRSFNLSVSVGIALFEALRQTGGLPKSL